MVVGIGIMRFADPPFGPNTFGHGAASSTILRIDPDKQLIIIMTRNARDAKYDEYSQKFVEAVYEGLAD